jgi:hypothetical protein
MIGHPRLLEGPLQALTNIPDHPHLRSHAVHGRASAGCRLHHKCMSIKRSLLLYVTASVPSCTCAEYKFGFKKKKTKLKKMLLHLRTEVAKHIKIKCTVGRWEPSRFLQVCVPKPSCVAIHCTALLFCKWCAIFILQIVSDVPARLGLKAPALAWPEAALAFKNPRPGQSRQPGLGSGLARPRPRLLYAEG